MDPHVPSPNPNEYSGWDTEPRLPPELECAIFELAALSRPSIIPTLVRIARRVKQWVEPILYRVVVLPGSRPQRQMDGFPPIPLDILLAIIAKRPSFVASAVKHIFLQNGRRPLLRAKLEIILASCSSISSLFVHCSVPAESLPSLDKLETLHRLAADLDFPFSPSPINFDQPFLRNVTHLELLGSYNDSDLPADLGIGLSLLPHLTHAAFNAVAEAVPGLHAIVRTNTHLQCIVFFTEEGVKPDLEDERFVGIGQTDFRLDWIRGATGGNDYWVLAETFIAAKRAGRISRSLYWILDKNNFRIREGVANLVS
ncbi:hypothetical protein DFH06DRAFT_523853 [Mycena polygramma]|nr:hypothetical protein DFH06DRAFT_523853 [Mycena polygramma]